MLCQPVLKTIDYQELPVPSLRMAKLFYEFLSRYNEWKAAKLQEALGIFMLFFLVLGIICILWFLPGRGLIIITVMLVLFYLAIRHYLDVNERVSHLYVNVYILHHHLIGKLEVGFCDHGEPCHCVESFRRYVVEKYNISLYNRSLS